MKNLKNYQFCLLMFLSWTVISDTIIGQNVSYTDAEKVAKNFFSTISPAHKNKAANINVANKYESIEGNDAYYYIFNMEPTGFVIVAGDQKINPIIGYSEESYISFEEDNENFWSYMSGQQEGIKRLKNAKVAAKEKNLNKWKELLSDNFEATTAEKTGVQVGPYTTTHWGQRDYFNTQCPVDDEGYDGYCNTGCVATCLAQVLKYYEHPPVHGYGEKEYEDDDYGTQYVNFCESVYEWDEMPDTLGEYNEEVAELMYNAAVSLETEFIPAGGSLAYFSDMKNALIYHFGYDDSIIRLKRSDDFDNDEEFFDLIKSELDEGRIVSLRGKSIYSSGSHVWIVDGYKDDDYYHMNVGWNKQANGWYFDNGELWEGTEYDFYPDSDGNLSYMESVHIMFNIMPPEEDGCQEPSTSDIEVDDIELTEAELNYEIYYETTHQFRYREVGSSSWTESSETQNTKWDIEDLTPGTEYEVQVRNQCCEGEWSDYSNSETFTTGSCAALEEEAISFSSTTETSTYVYTDQPYGDVLNQFRYRAEGEEEWIYTDIDDSYYRFLEDLEIGTEYEVEVVHQCTPGIWGNYSETASFMTEGEAGCDPPTGLSTSSIHEDYAYIYLSQPYGDTDNQFRYRSEEESEWTESNIADIHYRFLGDLETGTEYEFQARHKCPSNDEWSEYSPSHFFTTDGIAGQCTPVDLEDLDLSKNYMYYFVNSGKANQFRWRENSSQIWSVGTIKVKHYRRLPADFPTSGSIEMQVRYECEEGLWSDYSEGRIFDIQ